MRLRASVDNGMKTPGGLSLLQVAACGRYRRIMNDWFSIPSTAWLRLAVCTAAGVMDLLGWTDELVNGGGMQATR